MNRIRRLAFLGISCMVLITLSAQPPQEEVAKLFQPVAKLSDFSKIDNYVLGLKTKKNISEADLVKLITQKSNTRMEKARAIFIWIAVNIAYDTNYNVRTKEEALKQGKGVCEAYSGLFKSFGELAGLEVVTVHGDTKQY